ncbi:MULTISPECIES: Tat pathway signal protein [Haloferax]|uniref:Tat pathway signal protein n=1 Tax=Haloferax marinum TaxID=2666143 RepID=A0A6A8GB34_9EURY|nr:MULTISPECIES: Tat pathway signal protein [Haloferax]KAB1198682.1 Tat pathway signal protein [Haloferax sp. CBA1150]MRW97798.1 Tat pathway signal protein [Haloferax marinum]
MDSSLSRRRLLRTGLAVSGVGLLASLAGCSSLRGCTDAEIYLYAELAGSPPSDATVVSADDPRVAGNEWILEVVEGASGGHPRESSISDCLSDYDALRADLDALPESGGPTDRVYYVRIDGQVVRLRAAFFEGEETARSELVLPLKN